MSTSITFVTKPFEELTVYELYALLQLRSEVFVVEQQCLFADMDGQDEYALHVQLMESGKLAGYTRIFGPGRVYMEASIGRVVTSRETRRNGLGKLLMQQSVDLCWAVYPGPIRIGAQLYLQKFYEGFGFRKEGDIYLEDGIAHISMLLP